MGGGLAAETGNRRSADPVVAAGVVLQLQAAVLSQEGLAQGAAALAAELAAALRCDRVSVGWLEHGCVRVLASSHAVDFDSRQAQFEKIGAAMDESLEQAATIMVPAREGSSPLVTLVRGGALVASALSALPAWRILDPLPVLSRVNDDEDDEADEDEEQAIASFEEELFRPRR